MKNYGHTKTLFIQAGKYKWSYKYEHCIDCKGVEAKHKGNGRCTRCHDKYRRNKCKVRRGHLKIQSAKFHFRKRFFKYLEQKKPKRVYVTIHTEESKRQYKKDWYEKTKEERREVRNLLSKVYRRRKAGKPCMKMIVNGKEKYFPFAELLVKPWNIHSKEYQEYKIIDRQFQILKEHYERRNNPITHG